MKLMAHQIKNLEISSKNPRWGFFDDTGTGKTLTGIEIIKKFGLKTLVICPKKNVDAVWMEEIKKWAPSLFQQTINFWALSKKKHKMIDHFVKQCRVAVTSYETFRNQANYLKRFGFEMLLIDESHKVSNHQAQVTKRLTQFVWLPFIKRLYLFTGSPAPNIEIEYFSQARLIDPSVFGRYITHFRQQYFIQPNAEKAPYFWVMKKFDMNFERDLKKEFYEKLRSISSHVDKENVLDLPEQNFIVRPVMLDKKETASYLKMKNDLVIYFEELKKDGVNISAANQAVKCMKLRQGTSGFYYYPVEDNFKPDGTQKYRNEAHTVGTSKLEYLKELLEEIGNNQVIIATQFTNEILEIKKILPIGSYGIICGNNKISNDDQCAAASNDFISEKIQYLLVNMRVVSTGYNFQNCHYIVCYSLDYSLATMKQFQDRIYRHGQKHNCFYYFLLAVYANKKGETKETIDHLVYNCLQGKRDALMEALDYIKQD